VSIRELGSKNLARALSLWPMPESQWSRSREYRVIDDRQFVRRSRILTKVSELKISAKVKFGL